MTNLNKRYVFTYYERQDGRRMPCAAVTKLGNGLACYENLIALVDEVLPVNEAFAKAREKAAKLN